LLKANLKIHWSKKIWPPSSLGCNPLDYFPWSEVATEVRKHPHNTLGPLGAHISEVMADKDREVVIHLCKMFQSRIEAIVKASGDVFIKMCSL
jgi:hypothetical protein